ncbi:hypothetical protein CENSYa_0228 [Cenarchaeum symbiosum A]|uniref:Uncharacterized protein n=1 Tax=Cenarchaeum symbiosum (strain A) TaxID=414004 RepID=A0RU54_CENSY|nr:hypothetical protein CENSYa_0228 [Cenarchaeum symbiosum A]
MADSESYGVEKGHSAQFIEWLNKAAGERGIKFEARLYGYTLETDNFGSFEMFSWIGDARQSRRLIVRASKRFKVKVIEGGYKTREQMFHTSRTDYAMVRKGDRVIGRLQLEASRFRNDHWKIKNEERT